MAEKKNFWTQVISSMNAVVKFGSVSSDKQSIETLRVVGNDSRHHFIMDETLKSSVLNSPGKTTLKCGTDVKRDDRALTIRSENGDILIDAVHGRIKIQAKNIEFVATSDKPEEGNIEFRSQNDFEVHQCRDFVVNSSRNARIDAENLLGLKGHKQVHVITELFRGISACTMYDKKTSVAETVLGNLNI